MQFCPKCGSIIIAKKENGKMVLHCSCGYKANATQESGVRETVKEDTKADVHIVEADDDVRPEVDVECEKCSNKKAYFWSMQTRAADEPETKFFKCTKCGHTWRDYD
jgi:transcription factor S